MLRRRLGPSATIRSLPVPSPGAGNLGASDVVPIGLVGGEVHRILKPLGCLGEAAGEAVAASILWGPAEQLLRLLDASKEALDLACLGAHSLGILHDLDLHAHHLAD